MTITNLLNQCLNIDTEQIDKLLDSFEVTLDKAAMKRMLDNCIYQRNFNLLQEHIVRHVFETVKEAYKNELQPEKFDYSFNNQIFVLKYDGEKIKGKMHLDSISKEIKWAKEWEEKRNAPREFHLTKEDRKMLLDGGANEEDLDQVEWEANVCRYTLRGKTRNIREINREEAIGLLGRKSWLWGIDRTAFHWSTSQECLKNKSHEVSFESGLPGRYDNH